MRLTNTAAKKPQSPATMSKLVAAISAADANPTDVASTLLRHIQAINQPKPGSTWRPENGLKVRYGVKLAFPNRTLNFAPASKAAQAAAIEAGEPIPAPMYRAYEACAKIANAIAERDGREGEAPFGAAESDGKAVFDALCDAGVFEACGYAYPDGSGKASIRFAGEGGKRTVTAKRPGIGENITTLDDLGL